MKNLTLEVSLKPFYGLSLEQTRACCDQALEQWSMLIKDSECVSIMFWASDGSEILDYTGDLDSEMEWARYIGNGNAHVHPQIPTDPESISLHARSHLYRKDARPITYRRFAEIARCWREAVEALGKPVRIGTTFDPGGEFAPSSFKYERHREICLADTMGKASFVCCYGILNADQRPYAGFPEGIPQDTSMGTFLGRQFQHLAADIGFDFIWLSNGFGFGMETWMTRGPLFDGENFTPEQSTEIREKILKFWRDFRAECPTLGIETRGTNLSTGTDLASDATPLREIYSGGFDFEPPPNSPWAALNKDFGLEVAGYLSRIVELPAGKEIPFRFYIHDPWWLNSPWLDRYERQPHDIYLPLAVSRIDENGSIQAPQKLNLLSIDDSYGHMPDAVPAEASPHLLRAFEELPDTPGPLVWLYPFEQLHDAMFEKPHRPERLFQTDWFMREAINNGLPLNTIVSTRNFDSEAVRQSLEGRILVSPAPFDAATESLLIDWIESGQSAIVYGPLDNAPTLRKRLGLAQADALSGATEVSTNLEAIDNATSEEPCKSFVHRPVMSGGGLAETPSDDKPAQATATIDGQRRALAAFYRSDTGGRLWWLRGPLPLSISKTEHLPTPDARGTCFDFGQLNRQALSDLGWSIAFNRRSITQTTPVVSIHRYSNGWFFSGCHSDTTVELALGTPFGAPLLLGTETWIDDNRAAYRPQRGWRYECRVFVEQPGSSLVSHKEELPGQVWVKRRMWVHGLKDATLRFFPPTGAGEVTFWHNPEWPYVTGNTVPYEASTTAHGQLLTTTQPASGTVLISW
ncbi:hypothetical protein [Ruficoccus sp. ZRK36]|uniref:hypothetical protein n=1 Tax=Ruficoccus sp. ZRK36 TaxID=2866311 RepID=UPI001C730DE2|nr:hypothetical protein [Ruficoccus sp. ZRK36]QYY36877.1 hypothetical protein K0V07_05220 [Ruficoccus sp. ZRK36]